MGNCLFGSSSLDNSESSLIKVIASNGAVMEFYPPISVSWIVDEFPNHAIFNQHDLFWTPLSRHEHLCPGKSYLLLPLVKNSKQLRIMSLGHVRSNSVPEINRSSSMSNIKVAPYNKMLSVDNCGNSKSCKVAGRRSMASIANDSGFWKVKLVISSGEQLVGILSEDGTTEELIDNVRIVGKFGNGFFDKWNLSNDSSSSSRRSGSKKDSLSL